MNFIAGIMIGLTNESWLGCIFSSIGWGIIYCLYKYFFRADEIQNYLKRAKDLDRPLRWGIDPKLSFFIIEFNTAVVSALFFSLLLFGIRLIYF